MVPEPCKIVDNFFTMPVRKSDYKMVMVPKTRLYTCRFYTYIFYIYTELV